MRKPPETERYLAKARACPYRVICHIMNLPLILFAWLK